MEFFSHFMPSYFNSNASSQCQSPRSRSSSLLITKSRRRLLAKILSAEQDKIGQLMSHSTRTTTETTSPTSSQEDEQWVDEIVVVESVDDTLLVGTPLPSLRTDIDFSVIALESDLDSDYTETDFTVHTFDRPTGLCLIAESSDDVLSCHQSDQQDVEKYVKLGKRQEFLGRGSSGFVFAAMNPETGAVVALKETPMGFHDGRNQVENEIQIVRELKEEERTHFIVVTENGIIDDTLVSVTPYMNGGTLESLIQSRQTEHNLPVLDESIIRDIAHQVLTGLDILHRREHPIIHNDIKPANILLSQDGDAKLCDFGLSRRLENKTDKIQEYRGTVRYFAPEKFRKYNEQVDIWAFGLSLYECVAGLLPSGSDSFHAFRPDEDILGCVSADLRDFILCCLLEDPSARPSAFELRRHSFLSDCRGSGLRSLLACKTSGEVLLIEIAECLAEQRREWVPECFVEDMCRNDEERLRNICRATGLERNRVRRTIATLLRLHE